MIMKANQKKLIKDIEGEVRFNKKFIGKSKLDKKVMQVMEAVPRDQFVPSHMQAFAFVNGPVPIGYGQTISQPYIVALMTDLLALKPDYKVLEVGTGSGYQTAILSQLCAEVFSVERIAELSRRAEACFNRLGYQNIKTHVGNGYKGWPEHAPYDGIVVTAAAKHVPSALTDQLKPGGNLVIPVARSSFHQELIVVSKNVNGEIEERDILAVAFVPLVDDAYRESESDAIH